MREEHRLDESGKFKDTKRNDETEADFQTFKASQKMDVIFTRTKGIINELYIQAYPCPQKVS